MIRNFILILTIILFSSQAYSEKVVNWSKGHIACERFIRFCETNKRSINCQSHTSYVMGFLSSASIVAQIPIEKFNDSEAIKSALIEFCNNNPKKHTVHGALSILKEIMK